MALFDAGFRVGLVDADLFGPSIPGMLGLPADAKPTVSHDQKVIPVEAQGLKVMSMAMLTGDDAPAVMRGPMVTKYLQLFIGDVAWGGLDYLILDLPPGTGDTQLTLAQNFPLTGAVIVTTPQDVSLKIARRGARMFEQVKVPLLGVVENMSGFCCPNCGTVTDIFRKGGGERLAEALGAPFLGAVPLDAAVVDCGDDGTPLVRAWPDSAAAAAYRSIAARLADAADPGARLPVAFRLAVGGRRRRSRGGRRAAGRRAKAQPLAVERRDSRTLGIVWADGARQSFDVRDLRLGCPCAECVDEMNGRRRLDPATVPLNIEPTRVWAVGNYAIGVAFTDGHSTGIYSFERLRAMAEAETEHV